MMEKRDVSEIDIDYVARLARIELSGEEKQKLAPQLDKILDYFEKLKEVDVSGVEPTAHVFPIYNVWQEDVAEAGFSPGEALANAPAQRDNQVVVPKVVE